MEVKQNISFKMHYISQRYIAELHLHHKGLQKIFLLYDNDVFYIPGLF